MKEVIKIAAFDEKGRLILQPGEYTSIENAIEAIDELPAGNFLVVNVFVKQ
jgi:hypothetical protein